MPEAVKKRDENINRQASIANALGKDYINICLINVKAETSVLIKTFDGVLEELGSDKNPEMNYYEMCGKSIQNFTAPEYKDIVQNAVKLEEVTKELSDKQEYDFVCEVLLNGKRHDCQMKYMRLDDADHILMGFRFVDSIVGPEKKRKQLLEKALDNAEREKQILDALCINYTAAYLCDLKNDYLEVIKKKYYTHCATKEIQPDKHHSFSKWIRESYNTILIKESAPDYLEVFDAENLMKRLQEEESFVYRHKTVPNAVGNQYFETTVVRLYTDAFSFKIIMGYRPIDDLIAEEKRNRKKLERALKAAEDANKAKSAFLFNMSHDIRTPMNAIIGFSELLNSHVSEPEKVSEYSSKIKSSCDYLLSLLNDVLEMSRIESGKSELDETVISTEGFNDSIYYIFENQMAEKHIRFTRSSNFRQSHIYGDVVKLKEILLNILSNAYKYTLPGGSVDFRVEEIKSDRPGYAMIRTIVQDTGIGMSPTFLQNIFENFTRERNSTQSGQQGTGLGMAITKRLVELMNGTISVESEQGQGTKFTIIIPHRIADGEAGTQNNVSEFGKNKSFSGKRILLAEDNDLNAEIAMEILKERGFEIERALDGIECLGMLERQEPKYYDVILMDIQMPNMDGYKATQIIRGMENPCLAKIPIIAMTANAFSEDRKKALEMGMNAHIAKPISTELLEQTLSQIL